MGFIFVLIYIYISFRALDNNRDLSSLGLGLLDGLEAMQVLSLANNHLTEFPADVFSHMANLTQLFV